MNTKSLTVEISSPRLVSGVSQLEHVYTRAPPGCSINVRPIEILFTRCLLIFPIKDHHNKDLVDSYTLV